MGRATTTERLRQAALDCAELLGVGAVPGHHLEYDPRGWRCSCAREDCAAPGGHPRFDDWSRRTTPDPARLNGWWSDPRWPCSVLAPLGTRFDVIDMPARTGEVALGYLQLWAVPVGPVIRHEGRVIYLIEASCRSDLAELLIRERIGDPGRDLCYRGGGYLVVPPSNTGTPGVAEWLVAPAARHRDRLPGAGELLGAIGYAAHVIASSPDRPLGNAAGF
jgi:hypothetical protein